MIRRILTALGIWRHNPRVLEHAQALTGTDSPAAAFLALRHGRAPATVHGMERMVETLYPTARAVRIIECPPDEFAFTAWVRLPLWVLFSSSSRKSMEEDVAELLDMHRPAHMVCHGVWSTALWPLALKIRFHLPG